MEVNHAYGHNGLLPLRALPNSNACLVRKRTLPRAVSPRKSHYVRYPRAVVELSFQRARTEEKKRQRAEALIEAARGLALEKGVASVTLTAVANRAGIHYSAVRRYFGSHKEVLLHLAVEGWQKWSSTVCTALREPGPMSPDRVAAVLAKGLASDPLFCDMLANQHLHLEHEVDIERVLEIKRICNVEITAAADAIQEALPTLSRGAAFDLLLASYSLGATLWQIAHPPEGMERAYTEEEPAPPDWNVDFDEALTRLLTATCIGLIARSG